MKAFNSITAEESEHSRLSEASGCDEITRLADFTRPSQIGGAFTGMDVVFALQTFLNS